MEMQGVELRDVCQAGLKLAFPNGPSQQPRTSEPQLLGSQPPGISLKILAKKNLLANGPFSLQEDINNMFLLVSLLSVLFVLSL